MTTPRRVLTTEDSPKFIYSGQTNAPTANTAVKLVTQPKIVDGVIVQAMSTNTGIVFVGGKGVTTSTGFELQPGQATSIAIDNLEKVYIVGDQNNQKVCFLAS